MHASDTKRVALASTMSATIQLFNHFFDPERARFAIAMQVEPENEANGFGLDRVDIELLFDFRASLFGLYQPVAKRCHGSVPESLARILLHRADYMLGVIFRLVFIEKGDDLPHHGVHGFRFVADRLGHRNDPDAMFR